MSPDAQLCPCGLLSYCHVNRRAKVIFCTNSTCLQSTISKGRTVYQCRDESCFQRICAACHTSRPKLDKNLWAAHKETFTPIPKTAADPSRHRFGSSFTSHAQKLPDIVPPTGDNQSLADTIKNLTSKGPDHKPLNLDFTEKDAHLLTQLGRLPQVITTPVLDWAPFGLTQRFATLYASALWNLVKTFDTNDVSLQKLYALILLYLPALILHDSRRNTDDAATTSSHRSIISSRIKQAESGLWLPLVDDLIQAHLEHLQQTTPKTPTWKTRCSRAVHKSLSGSWSLAFRALQADSCPPLSQDTFDQVATKFICTQLSAQEQDILSTAGAKARRSCYKHLAAKSLIERCPAVSDNSDLHPTPAAPKHATHTHHLPSQITLRHSGSTPLGPGLGTGHGSSTCSQPLACGSGQTPQQENWLWSQTNHSF